MAFLRKRLTSNRPVDQQTLQLSNIVFENEVRLGSRIKGVEKNLLTLRSVDPPNWINKLRGT